MRAEKHLQHVHSDAGRVFWVLFKRDLVSSLFSLSPYLVVLFACLLLTFFTTNYVATLSKLLLLVSADPTNVPLFVSVAVIALYLGIMSSTSITSEREHGTLEVLLAAPVTPTARVLSVFLRDIALFLLAMVVLFLDLVFLSEQTNLGIGVQSLRTVSSGVVLVWPMISFSIFLSCTLTKVRTSVLVFIIAYAGLAALSVLTQVLDGMSVQSLSLAMIYLRDGLSIVMSVVAWVSPFSYIATLNGGFSGVEFFHGWIIALAVAYSLIFLAVAALILSRRES